MLWWFLRPVGYKMVWRGVVEVPIDDYDEGEEKVWWGFTSCTAVCGTLADAAYFDRSHVRIMFSIETSSGKSVRSHSDFMVEDEILLPPGIRLKVVSKVMLDESLYMVHLEDIQPPYGYLIPPSPSPPQRDRPVPPVRPMPIRLSQVSPSNVEIPILLNMPKDVKNCSISDERFERCIGDVSIEGDGRVAVHSKRLCSGDVRGKQDYSSGQHRLKIRLQKNRSRLSIIIGVISKSTPMKIDSYKNPTFYGWASLTQCYLGGVFRKSGDAYSMHDNCENDTIELIIDVEGRMLQYTNQRTEQSAQLAVDVSRCPLPWKLHLSLGGDDDEVRLVNE